MREWRLILTAKVANVRMKCDVDSIDQIDKTSGKYSKGKIIANLNIEESLWFLKTF